MSDIFINYSRQDKDKAQLLADALIRRGWSVWWDAKIPAGKTFDEVIEQELKRAKCVLVLWSKNSIKSAWVKEEANEAKLRGILVPLLVDEVKSPFGFTMIQARNLVEWTGSENQKEFIQLIDDIRSVIHGRDVSNFQNPDATVEPFNFIKGEEPIASYGSLLRDSITAAGLTTDILDLTASKSRVIKKLTRGTFSIYRDHCSFSGFVDRNPINYNNRIEYEFLYPKITSIEYRWLSGLVIKEERSTGIYQFKMSARFFDQAAVKRIFEAMLEFCLEKKINLDKVKLREGSIDRA